MKGKAREVSKDAPSPRTQVAYSFGLIPGTEGTKLRCLWSDSNSHHEVALLMNSITLFQITHFGTALVFLFVVFFFF